MDALNHFNPLRVAKRNLRPYTTLPSQDTYDDASDPEKRASLDDSSFASSPASSYSSRTPSRSYHPPTATTTTTTTPPSHRRSSSAARKASASAHTWSHSYAYRAPRRFSRYFTLLLGSTLVIFILTLTRLSWSSARNVQLGLAKPPPPPAPWEAFPFLKRYHGGVRTLTSRQLNVPEYPGEGNNAPQVREGAEGVDNGKAAGIARRQEGGALPPLEKFDPYPAYGSKEYQEQFGAVQECFLDKERKIRIPKLRAYNGVPQGMPDAVMGSYSIFGLRDDFCFERFGRLGPYGLGYSRKLGGSGAAMEGDREGAEQVWEEDPEVDFRKVKWAEVQTSCEEANHLRFKAKSKGRNHFFQSMAVGGPDMEDPFSTSATPEEGKYEVDKHNNANFTISQRPPKTPSGKTLLPRTAVLIRTWWDYKYDDEDLFFLRALVSELSILSGGEYTLHFLIHVKDDNAQIWADDATYQRVLDDALPAEFRGMGTLWSERQMGLIYGGLAESFYRDLPVHGAYRGAFMPVQYFAHQHPEYDFFWHWEMDVRYTGHYYHLFDKISKWAAQQPRKGLWERNARFYVPAAHGSWDDFRQMVRVQTEHGTSSKNNIWSSLTKSNPNLPDAANPNAQQKAETFVWGPERPLDDELDTAHDPVPPTSYAKDNYEWGVGEEADLIVFNPLFDPAGTNWILASDVTGYNTTRSLPPRRTAIVTASRLSRRLLETMHAETSLGRRTMFSEMWPASCALQHGLKAVYAPHPVYVDRRWPVDYLAAVFNGGRNGASGGARTSVFSDERQHNFRGTTWYYDAGFAPNLWKRWLGYKVDNDGGEQWEVHNEGRMCLPGMLLHPVKQVDLVFEHQEGEV